MAKKKKEQEHVFPSFWEGLSLRPLPSSARGLLSDFPFLLGGTFIEAVRVLVSPFRFWLFPSFWEGLSLRHASNTIEGFHLISFPFLLGGTFIEASPER